MSSLNLNWYDSSTLWIGVFITLVYIDGLPAIIDLDNVVSKDIEAAENAINGASLIGPYDGVDSADVSGLIEQLQSRNRGLECAVRGSEGKSFFTGAANLDAMYR